MPAGKTMPVFQPSDANDDLPMVSPVAMADKAAAHDAAGGETAFGDAGMPPVMSPAANAAFAVAGRLESLLREEITALRGASVDALKQMNQRKSQCLLELSRAARALGDETAPPALARRLDRLRQVATDNQDTLSTHIVAVRDIAGLIAAVMQAHESDGTYADRPALRSPLGGEVAGEPVAGAIPVRHGSSQGDNRP